MFGEHATDDRDRPGRAAIHTAAEIGLVLARVSRGGDHVGKSPSARRAWIAAATEPLQAGARPMRIGMFGATAHRIEPRR